MSLSNQVSDRLPNPRVRSCAVRKQTFEKNQWDLTARLVFTDCWGHRTAWRCAFLQPAPSEFYWHGAGRCERQTVNTYVSLTLVASRFQRTLGLKAATRLATTPYRV